MLLSLRRGTCARSSRLACGGGSCRCGAASGRRFAGAVAAALSAIAMAGACGAAFRLRRAMTYDLRLTLQRTTHYCAALIADGLGAPVAQCQQTATFRAGQRQRTIPDGERTGRIVGAAEE